MDIDFKATTCFFCKQNAFIMGLLLVVLGCDQQLLKSSWHHKFDWEAKKYFSDPKVIDLCRAIERNDTQEMQRLIEGGANVNEIGKGNMTTLLWAFPENKIERFKMLLEHGASPNIVVEDDFNTRQAIIPGDSVTILAARSAFPDHLGLVLKHGGDPNIVHRRFNETPIHAVLESIAPFEVKKEKIDLLAKAGADLNHLSVGAPPVMKSFNMNGPKIVLQLIEAGADPCADSDDGLVRLVHLVARAKPPYPEGYDRLCIVLESHGESIAEAKKDNERRKSYNQLPPDKAKKLRDKERLQRAEIKKNRSLKPQTTDSGTKHNP